MPHTGYSYCLSLEREKEHIKLTALPPFSFGFMFFHQKLDRLKRAGPGKVSVKFLYRSFKVLYPSLLDGMPKFGLTSIFCMECQKN